VCLQRNLVLHSLTLVVSVGEYLGGESVIDVEGSAGPDWASMEPIQVAVGA
jgi:hypothetical protein